MNSEISRSWPSVISFAPLFIYKFGNEPDLGWSGSSSSLMVLATLLWADCSNKNSSSELVVADSW